MHIPTLPSLPEDAWRKIALEAIREVRESYPSSADDMYRMARDQTDCPCYGADCMVNLLKNMDNLIKILGYSLTPIPKEDDEHWGEKYCKIV